MATAVLPVIRASLFRKSPATGIAAAIILIQRFDFVFHGLCYFVDYPAAANDKVTKKWIVAPLVLKKRKFAARGDIAQLVERYIRIVEAGVRIPLSPLKKFDRKEVRSNSTEK